MPIELIIPDQPPALTHARIMRIEVEDNIEKSVVLWVSLGTKEGEEFVEWHHPITGVTSTIRIKLEDGHHPITGTALGKCPICDRWWPSTMCPECQEHPALNMYDGFSRLTADMTPQVVGLADTTNLRTFVGAACYAFLLNEEIPDPDTWEIRKLLSAQIV